MKTTTKPITIKKSVRHDFTADEIKQLNVDFGNAYDTLRATEAEFDNVKAVWKAKTTEAESRMTTLRATINAGFEQRLKDCVVIFRPTDGKKDFYLAETFSTGSISGQISAEAKLLCTEDMTQADFEQDLIQADSAFENRGEIELWNAEADCGLIVVGSQGGKWFAAVRGSVGKHRIEERLDSEQPASKKRFDAIQRASNRVNEWLKSTLGRDAAKGFEEAIYQAVEAEKEKAA